MNYGLKEQEIAVICDILSQAETLDKAVLFGSRAMGLHRHNSDVDLLLYGVTFEDTAKISNLLEETVLPYQFDLVIHDESNHAINAHVRQYGKAIYERKGAGDWGRLGLRLGDIITFCNGKKRPSIQGGIPVYGGNGILDYTSGHNQENSIIIGRVGAYCGSVFYEKNQHWVSDNAIAAVNKDNSDIIFDYYLLKSMNLNNRHIGTSQPLLTQEILNSIEVEVPPLPTQRAIAATLSCLDDKIALNNRMNATLEEMAQAVFTDMFPDVSTGENVVGKYITPKRGQTLISKNAVMGNVPVIAGGLTPTVYHNKANTQEPVVTISASGANAGFVNLWSVPVWASDSSFIDKSMTDDVYFWYVMLKMRQDEIYEAQTGSAQPHIYPSHIARLSTIELSASDTAKYGEYAAPLFEQIAANSAESAHLATIRDALLPKLMSGEIEVKSVI